MRYNVVWLVYNKSIAREPTGTYGVCAHALLVLHLPRVKENDAIPSSRIARVHNSCHHLPCRVRIGNIFMIPPMTINHITVKGWGIEVWIGFVLFSISDRFHGQQHVAYL